MIVPLYKVKERGMNVRTIEVLACYVVGKVYDGILVDIVCRVTGGLTDDEKDDLEQGGGV